VLRKKQTNFYMTNTELLADIEAVIFDMDGVLTDSEPIWKVAMQEVFDEVGCTLTRKDFEKTVGLRIDEVCNYWYMQNAWENYSPKEVESKIVGKMVGLLESQAVPLPGVLDALSYFRSRGLKIGLATSSYTVLIETILTKLGISHFFDVTHSAELEEFGKPHPAVFLSCANQLGVHPLKCLVIEDSLNGVISAKAARMRVLCIPEKSHSPNSKLLLADAQHEGLDSFIEKMKK
jgi:mannitol-1-/sugar-/sorbitol-6-/2-deoxyglucose-6-phosphatase